jgi:hypothetical protein
MDRRVIWAFTPVFDGLWLGNDGKEQNKTRATFQ